MHITENVLESLLGTLLNVLEKTKDGPKVRTNLKILGIREDLHRAPPEETETEMDMGKKIQEEERTLLPPSCFTLSQKEIDRFFKCLARIKVSSGFCANISGYLD